MCAGRLHRFATLTPFNTLTGKAYSRLRSLVTRRDTIEDIQRAGANIALGCDMAELHTRKQVDVMDEAGAVHGGDSTSRGSFAVVEACSDWTGWDGDLVSV